MHGSHQHCPHSSLLAADADAAAADVNGTDNQGAGTGDSR